MSTRKNSLKAFLRRAQAVKAEAEALRQKHAALSQELAAIRKEHERASAEYPQIELAHVYRLVEEGRLRRKGFIHRSGRD